MKVYFISGLAADRRVFKYIQVPGHCEIVHLDWIEPLRNETLAQYSRRLAERIDPAENFGLVGLSMGGMIAAEIASFTKPSQTVLISSVPSANYLPVYFKWIGKLKIHRLTPVRLIKSMAIMKRLFTTETPEDKETLKMIIRESDPSFIYWAMDAILKWDNKSLPANYIHIHGTKDEVLPFRFVKPTHVIDKAGHLMVMNRAEDINKILLEIFR